MGEVGQISMFAGSSAPDKWLLCDGSEISRGTYSDLFEVIGTTYGVGDGSTTFGLPDLRGRSPLGAGEGEGLTERTLGGYLGEESHQLSVAELASHNHTAPEHRHLGGAHAHTINGNLASGSGTARRALSHAGTGDNNVFSEEGGSVNTGFAGNSATTNKGSSIPHNTIHPVQVVNFIICYESVGGSGGEQTVTYLPIPLSLEIIVNKSGSYTDVTFGDSPLD